MKHVTAWIGRDDLNRARGRARPRKGRHLLLTGRPARPIHRAGSGPRPPESLRRDLTLIHVNRVTRPRASFWNWRGASGNGLLKPSAGMDPGLDPSTPLAGWAKLKRQVNRTQHPRP